MVSYKIYSVYLKMVYKAVNQSEEFTNAQIQMRLRYFSSKMREQEIFTNLAKVEICLLEVKVSIIVRGLL